MLSEMASRSQIQNIPDRVDFGSSFKPKATPEKIRGHLAAGGSTDDLQRMYRGVTPGRIAAGKAVLTRQQGDNETKKGKITDEQRSEVLAFLQLNPKPTMDQKRKAAQEIGVTFGQLNAVHAWRTMHKYQRV